VSNCYFIAAQLEMKSGKFQESRQSIIKAIETLELSVLSEDSEIEAKGVVPRK